MHCFLQARLRGVLDGLAACILPLAVFVNCIVGNDISSSLPLVGESCSFSWQQDSPF